MKVSRMSAEEDIQASIVSPISRHPHVCGTLHQTVVMSTSLSPSPPLSMIQSDNVSCPFADIPLEKCSLRASLKMNPVKNNHRSPSPVAAVCSTFSEDPNDECFLELPKTTHLNSTVVHFRENLPYQTCSVSSVNSSPVVSHSNGSIGASRLPNGPSSVLSLDGVLQSSGSAMDINGYSRSQTPVSIESDRTKMDLAKLDETIDYVIANAISDDPVYGMFVLSCRSREPSHLSSPTLHANTPSSGHLASPSPSSTPPSPHSNQVLSPTLNAVTKAHGFVSSTSLANAVGASSISRYMVDQNTSIIQFSPCTISPQFAPSPCNNKQSLSFLHLYQDPSTSYFERPTASHLNQTNTLTPTFLSTAVSGFQPNSALPNFVSHSSATVIQNCTSLASPQKLISVRTGTVAMPTVALVPTTVHTYTHTPVTYATARSVQLINSPPTSVCFVQNAVRPTSVQEQIAEKLDCIQPVSFRQPVVPTQPAGVPCNSRLQQTVALAAHDHSNFQTGISTSDQGFLLGPPKKRSHSSCVTNPKRRKTSTSTTLTSLLGPTKLTTPDHCRVSNLGDYFDKLKSMDTKLIVSAPQLKAHAPVLQPFGGSDSSSNVRESDETLLLKRVGSKYCRGPFAVKVPRCFVSDCPSDQMDLYVTHHLWLSNSPIPLMNPVNVVRDESVQRSVICSSPEPISFENHMMALFSSLQKTNVEEKPALPLNSTFHSAVEVFPSRLLPIFSDAISGCSKPSTERSTPPLPLFHVPNPKLIGETQTSATTGYLNASTKNSFSLGSPVIDGSLPVSTVEFSKDFLATDSKSDETFTKTALLNPREEFPQSEKLLISFNINHATSSNIPHIVQHITDLLGIERSAVCYQPTPSGAQITLDRRKSSNGKLFKDLEHQLRERLTPLSVNVEVSSCNSSPMFCGTRNFVRDTSPVSVVSSLTKSENCAKKSDQINACGSDFMKYPEESVTISTLSSVKSNQQQACVFCDKLISSGFIQRKSLDDLAASCGLNSRPDICTDLTFCSERCIAEYTRSLSAHRLHSSDAESGTESRSQTLVLDISSDVPVILQTDIQKFSKRQLANGQARRKRQASGQMKQKRWSGTRWRVFSSDSLLSTATSMTALDHDAALKLSLEKCPPLYDSDLVDSRVCPLCNTKGDSTEELLGRLLPLNINQWIHLNCALWCFEVYETVGGSLNNVETWVEKALDTTCAHCDRLGAGLPCYNPRCTFCYHVACAVSIGCMFFTDRGMYCPQHQPKDPHPMQLSSLAVRRRAYIARDENTQVGDVIHEEDRQHVIRIGTVCLHNLGQLLPHQLESGRFHNRRYIYPVGFRSTRIYWSMRIPRRRSIYMCEILEAEGYPVFRVTVKDSGLVDVVYENSSCSAVWQSILTEIEGLREKHKLVRLFSQHLKGEDLYGLSEPHIVRAIESLPGVDCLRDYVFNFGRMELIAEMPLAINPSGCARSEPKMQTYVKRSNGSTQTAGHSSPSCRNSLPGFPRSAHPGLSASSIEWSKQYQSSRSQQYRRLKSEVAGNVILGRSRIQGLGLFAARDLEPQTMVIEYIGELIRLELANKREKEYEAHNRGIYMFRLDEDTVIDATVCGGLARYINHSCQPNCFAEHLNFGDHAHIVIITNRHIDKGEELCYDYNFDLEDGGDKIPCLCRAPGCRKWMN